MPTVGPAGQLEIGSMFCPSIGPISPSGDFSNITHLLIQRAFTIHNSDGQTPTIPINIPNPTKFGPK
jgi:hypothetical protein